MRFKPEERRHLDLYCLREDENLYDAQYHQPQAGYTYGEAKMDYPLNESGFGDEHFFFESTQGNPQYEAVEKVWDEFIRWMRKRLRQMKAQQQEETYEMKMAKQLIDFAKVRNAHSIYILIKRNWVEFRDNYLCVEGCPESMMEFIRGIMYKKMTEQQMWGGDEERMPIERVIIFDKNLMPKEGEDTGNLRFEYRPNYREEMLRGQYT